MRILLLGGTGAIGDNLVHILSEHSYESYVTSRLHRENKPFVTYILGNARDNDFIKELCTQQWDVIVDFMSYKTSEFEKRIDLLLSNTKQYFFISSARVYADIEHPIKEDSPRLLDVCKDLSYIKTDEYALTKARQEDILRIHSKDNNFTIIRPYITYSNSRLQLGVLEKEEWLYRAIQGHTVIFPKDMVEKKTTLTSGYDVALGIFNLIGKKEALGESFHITSEHIRTWDEIIKIYQNAFMDLTGRKLNIKEVDLDSFFKCRDRGLEWQVIYDRLYNRDFDVEKENLYAGSKYFISPEDGLKECLRDFINCGRPFKTINYANEAQKDRISKEKYRIKNIPGLYNKFIYIIKRFSI